MPGASEEPVQEGGSRSAFAQAPMTANGDQEREGRDAVPGGAAGPANPVGAVGGRRQPEPLRPAIAVLADRIAAALVHHEPGWRLPRHTALARRYNVSTAEIDAAVTELTSRHLRPPPARRPALPGQPRRVPDPDRGRARAGLAGRPDGRTDRLPELAGLVAPGSRGHRMGAADPAGRPGRRDPGAVGRERRARGVLHHLPDQGDGRAVHQRSGPRRLGQPDRCCRSPRRPRRRTRSAASSRPSASRGRSTSSCSRRRPRWPGACAWPPGSPRRW